MTTQTRAARRQLLVDRWTERLNTAGDPHAEQRAKQFLADMDDLGFDVPASLNDAPLNCLAPGLMETSNPQEHDDHGCPQEVPR